MLNDKKRAYAEARIAGQSMKEAAITAGYSEATAKQAGYRLDKEKQVQEYIARMAKTGRDDVVAIKEAEKPNIDKPEKRLFQPKPLEVLDDVNIIEYKGGDPLEFMRRVMQDEVEDLKIRLDAAKALASFTIAKPGEKGKKEAQADKAKEAAKKFSNLRAVK